MAQLQSILFSVQSSSIANSRIYAYCGKVNKPLFYVGLSYTFFGHST